MRNFIIIGASYLQLPLIKSARKKGFTTHVFAWEDGSVAHGECDEFYPVSITDLDTIYRICDALEPVGVATIASDLGAGTVHALSRRYDLLRNAESSISKTTNKAEMRRAFEVAGLCSPSFKALVETEVAAYEIPETVELPVIVKPVDRSGSRGVTRVDDVSQLPTAMLLALNESFSKEIIIETFITGVEASVETMSWNGEHRILAITDKVTTGPPHFVELEHHQPSLLPPEIQREILSLVPKALDSLEIRYGAAHCEVIIDDAGKVWLTEIGARMGGDFIGSHLVPLSTGYDYVGAVIDVATNSFVDARTHERGYAGVKFLNPNNGIITQIDNSVSRYPEIIEHAIFLRPGDHCRSATHSGERAGYFIYYSGTHRFKSGMEEVIPIQYSQFGNMIYDPVQ